MLSRPGNMHLVPPWRSPSQSNKSRNAGHMNFEGPAQLPSEKRCRIPWRRDRRMNWKFIPIAHKNKKLFHSDPRLKWISENWNETIKMWSVAAHVSYSNTLEFSADHSIWHLQQKKVNPSDSFKRRNYINATKLFNGAEYPLLNFCTARRKDMMSMVVKWRKTKNAKTRCQKEN